MRTCEVNAPCKINLALNVVGRRRDGYHLLEMVMQALDLQDTIRLTVEQGDGITLTAGEGIPGGENNLAWRAARLFLDHTGEGGRVNIHLTKCIPMQAGLAGGSADAAGVLVGLNALCGTGLSQEELCRLGAQLGADVPFCIVGGTALVEGIGERITPLPPLEEGWVLLLKPKEGIDTAGSFRRYDQLAHPPQGALVEKIRQGISQQDLQQISEGLGNQLEAVAQLPQIAHWKVRLKELGAVGSLMSGSGSAVFGLFPCQREAQQAFVQLQSQGEQVFLCRPIPHGPTVHLVP